MIARRIDRDVVNDNYRALALYVADAYISGHKGEKTFHSWYTGGEAENYLEGLIEVEATQAMNTKVEEEKTYHLMVSFRPEDENKLTKEALEDIERMYAEALGFADHQRHCGVHVNTNNWHLHIAYNRIHPQSFKSSTPYYDFPKLSRTSRAIEQKYGLAVDNGMEPDAPRQDGQANAKVKTLEAQSGRESLFSYIMRYRPALMELLSEATSWPDIHHAFLQHGLLLKASGNGLTIRDRYGKHQAKASSIDRSLSKGQLMGRFGEFREADSELLRTVESIDTYSAAPLQEAPERGQLYSLFQTDLARRKEALAQINTDGSKLYAECRDRWDKKRRAVEQIPMLKRDRQRIRMELKKREQAELEKLRSDTSARRTTVRTEMPYTTWTKYLQHKAVLGDETALAVLRSKKEIVHPENANATTDSQAEPPPPMKPLQNKRLEIAEAHGLADRHRQALLAVVKMREVLEREAGPDQPGREFKYSIDTKGTVIFHLAGGRAIRDTGREIHYSSHNDHTRDLAMKYASARWGRALINQDGIIQRSPNSGQEKNNQKINYPQR